MNQRTRARYVVLKDFQYVAPVGIGNLHLSYSKGDELNMRVSGRMTMDFLKKGYIKLIEEPSVAFDGQEEVV